MNLAAATVLNRLFLDAISDKDSLEGKAFRVDACNCSCKQKRILTFRESTRIDASHIIRQKTQLLPNASARGLRFLVAHREENIGVDAQRQDLYLVLLHAKVVAGDFSAIRSNGETLFRKPTGKPCAPLQSAHYSFYVPLRQTALRQGK